MVINYFTVYKCWNESLNDNVVNMVFVSFFIVFVDDWIFGIGSIAVDLFFGAYAFPLHTFFTL